MAPSTGRKVAIRRAENAGASRRRIRLCSAALVDGWLMGPPKIAEWETRAARSGSACEHIRALRRDLLCASADDIARSGLTGPQVSVMAHLVMNGPATVTELARELGTSHSTVSGIVDRLQVRGFLQRVQDEADRRYTRICVTEKVDRYVENLESDRSTGWRPRWVTPQVSNAARFTTGLLCCVSW